MHQLEKHICINTENNAFSSHELKISGTVLQYFWTLGSCPHLLFKKKSHYHLERDQNQAFSGCWKLPWICMQTLTHTHVHYIPPCNSSLQTRRNRGMAISKQKALAFISVSQTALPLNSQRPLPMYFARFRVEILWSGLVPCGFHPKP